MDAVADNIWPWTGQIYEVDMSQDELQLFHMVPGLSESERDLLLAIIQHANNDYHRTDQKTVKAHLDRRNKPCSDSLIKKNIKILSELGVFSHYTQSRPGRKPASIYSLRMAVAQCRGRGMPNIIRCMCGWGYRRWLQLAADSTPPARLASTVIWCPNA